MIFPRSTFHEAVLWPLPVLAHVYENTSCCLFPSIAFAASNESKYMEDWFASFPNAKFSKNQLEISYCYLKVFVNALFSRS